MNMKWVIIGTIFIVLLVAFGRNPVQEAREQRRKEIDEKGVLVYEIEKHLEENQSSPRFGSRMMPPQQQGQQPYGSVPGVPPVPPYAPIPAGAPPAQLVPPAGKNAPQGYYPPPPQPDGGAIDAPMYNPSAPRSQLQREKGDLRRLPDEVALNYDGAKVFGRTPDGKLHPLPDGRYLVNQGSMVLEVAGGERVAITAYNP